MYFQRDGQGLPRAWLERIKHNFRTIPPHFNTDRMVGEYRDRAYAPLARSWFRLTADRNAPARVLAQRHATVRKGFGEVKILGAHIADLTGIQVGDLVEVRVDVDLGPLSAEDVVVELVLGHASNNGDLHNRIVVALDPPSLVGGSAPGSAHPPAVLPALAVALAHAGVPSGGAGQGSDAMPSDSADESALLEPVAAVAPLIAVAGAPGGIQAFEGSHRMERSGSFAYGIRVRARTASEYDAALRDLVLWA